jgi:Tfp pilus assembly protein PilO
MKIGNILLVAIIVAIIGVIVGDRLYVDKSRERYNILEDKLIETSNKLATAKIIHEDKVHVRDLVLKNMDLPDQVDTIPHESHFFEFITTCVNDLKLKLILVEPKRPVTEGSITTYTYNIEVEGDFFSLGELCSKLENSRRIVSLETYDVSLEDLEEKATGGAQHKKIKVKMSLDTYRVKKSTILADSTVNPEKS